MFLQRSEIIARQPAVIKLWRTHAIHSWMLVLLSVSLCLGNFAGGEESWQGEAFAVAREVPGSINTWVATLFVSITVYTVGVIQEQCSYKKKLERRHWLLIIGAMMCSTWFFLLSYCFMMAKGLDPYEVSWNGIIVWAWIGLLWALKAAIDF